jgi:predicted alpha/beta-hydrolase family hydrolase
MSKSSATVAREITFAAASDGDQLPALLHRPPGAKCLCVLSHGAGAGMRHPFFETLVPQLAARGVATFRYEFPYMAAGRRLPDPARILEATVRSAVAAAAGEAGDLPLVAGGKSMGGRMTSQAAAAAPLPGVRGLVFLGFPLHPAGKPSVQRSDHLGSVELPMLFLQGTRDRLATLDLFEPVLDRLGARATLHVVAGGDHSFATPRSNGRSEREVFGDLSQAIAHWLEGKVLASSR